MADKRDPIYDEVNALLDHATNALGKPIYPVQRNRLVGAVLQPSERRWEDVHGIILRDRPGFGLTLWQAVLAVDPTFPDRGPHYNQRGWPRWPDQDLYLRAIRYAVTRKD